MKIAEVQFRDVVSHGGQLKSASASVPSNPDRPGSTPCDIEFDPETMVFAITKTIQSKVRTKFVHVSNVTGWEVMPEAPKKEKKP